MTKRQIKAKYVRAEIGMSEAITDLMFDHGMDRGDAINYLLK